MVFFGGFFVRIARPDSNSYSIIAKTIFAVNTVILFTRFTRYYAVSKTLGPKVFFFRFSMFPALVGMLHLLILIYIVFIQRLHTSLPLPPPLARLALACLVSPPLTSGAHGPSHVPRSLRVLLSAAGPHAGLRHRY